jgi:hypothetical protein
MTVPRWKVDRGVYQARRPRRQARHADLYQYRFSPLALSPYVRHMPASGQPALLHPTRAPPAHRKMWGLLPQRRLFRLPWPAGLYAAIGPWQPAGLVLRRPKAAIVGPGRLLWEPIGRKAPAPTRTRWLRLMSFHTTRAQQCARPLGHGQHWPHVFEATGAGSATESAGTRTEDWSTASGSGERRACCATHQMLSVCRRVD